MKFNQGQTQNILQLIGNIYWTLFRIGLMYIGNANKSLVGISTVFGFTSC